MDINSRQSSKFRLAKSTFQSEPRQRPASSYITLAVGSLIFYRFAAAP